jgi:hypothetical protein
MISYCSSVWAEALNIEYIFVSISKLEFRSYFRQIVERNGQSWPIKYEDMVVQKNFESFKEYVMEIFK